MRCQRSNVVWGIIVRGDKAMEELKRNCLKNELRVEEDTKKLQEIKAYNNLCDSLLLFLDSKNLLAEFDVFQEARFKEKPDTD